MMESRLNIIQKSVKNKKSRKRRRNESSEARVLIVRARVDGHDMGHHRNTINSEIFFIFFALHNLLCVK